MYGWIVVRRLRSHVDAEVDWTDSVSSMFCECTLSKLLSRTTSQIIKYASLPIRHFLKSQFFEVWVIVRGFRPVRRGMIMTLSTNKFFIASPVCLIYYRLHSVIFKCATGWVICVRRVWYFANRQKKDSRQRFSSPGARELPFKLSSGPWPQHWDKPWWNKNWPQQCLSCVYLQVLINYKVLLVHGTVYLLFSKSVSNLVRTRGLHNIDWGNIV